MWAAIDRDEDDFSEQLAADHGITALPGWHFGASTPHLRIPFGGRRKVREALRALRRDPLDGRRAIAIRIAGTLVRSAA